MKLFKYLIFFFIAQGLYATPDCSQILATFQESIEFSQLIGKMLSPKETEFIPGNKIGASGSKYNEILPLKEGFKNESNIIYLNQKQRQPLEIFLSDDGRLINSKGFLVDTQLDENERAIYVMDKMGHIYLSHGSEVGIIHHSSLVAGESIAAAGELEAEDGIITMINRSSGHYFPDPIHLKQFVDELLARGANLKHVRLIGHY